MIRDLGCEAEIEAIDASLAQRGSEVKEEYAEVDEPDFGMMERQRSMTAVGQSKSMVDLDLALAK